MSSMLEQAIVDAKSLREAAIKNAEETLIEKYSDDIKEAVEKLLEQDDELSGLGDEDTEEEGPEGIPLAAMEDELPLDPEAEKVDVVIPADQITEPNLDEMIEFDLDKIKEQLDEFEAANDVGTPEPHEEVAEELAEEVEITDDEELEEEVELTEEELSGILEKVIVDMAPTMSGYAGRPQKELEFEKDKHLAVLAQEEGIDVLKKENKELQSQILKLQESIELHENKETKYKEAIISIKEKFDQMSLVNARLLYTNKVLNSDSLNERQKQKVVDAISNVSSAEEAKVIFETLESAVGSAPSRRRNPKSLSEMVEKRSSSLLASRRNKQRKSDVPDGAKSRMQRLAGIK